MRTQVIQQNSRSKEKTSDAELEKIENQKKKLEKKLEKEYRRIRNNCENMRQAYSYFDSAQANDDIYYRLLKLEKETRRLRTGGFFSRGAKTHRGLLRKLQKLGVE